MDEETIEITLPAWRLTGEPEPEPGSALVIVQEPDETYVGGAYLCMDPLQIVTLKVNIVTSAAYDFAVKDNFELLDSEMRQSLLNKTPQ